MPAYCQRYSPAQTFGQSRIAVTLYGEQWLALITELQGDKLGPQGHLIALRAVDTLRRQVVEASARAPVVNHR